MNIRAKSVKTWTYPSPGLNWKKLSERPITEPIYVSALMNEMILQPVQIFFHVRFSIGKWTGERMNGKDFHFHRFFCEAFTCRHLKSYTKVFSGSHESHQSETIFFREVKPFLIFKIKRILSKEESKHIFYGP